MLEMDDDPTARICLLTSGRLPIIACRRYSRRLGSWSRATILPPSLPPSRSLPPSYPSPFSRGERLFLSPVRNPPTRESLRAASRSSTLRRTIQMILARGNVNGDGVGGGGVEACGILARENLTLTFDISVNRTRISLFGQADRVRISRDTKLEHWDCRFNGGRKGGRWGARARARGIAKDVEFIATWNCWRLISVYTRNGFQMISS